jgi:hypothetical protein
MFAIYSYFGLLAIIRYCTSSVSQCREVAGKLMCSINIQKIVLTESNTIEIQYNVTLRSNISSYIIICTYALN